jgi:hypothetical protein
MAKVPLARIGQSIATLIRHLVPIGGIFGRDWHPVTALAVYWLESVLLVLATALVCGLMLRKTRDSVVNEAGIHPRDLLWFHLGSLAVFLGFFAGVVVILVGNGHIERPAWREMREGAQAMLLVVSAGVVLDLWRFDTFTVQSVQARVNACHARWGLFWLLGFAGTILMMVTERPAMFFGFFAVLKAVFESWARIAGVARRFSSRPARESS